MAKNKTKDAGEKMPKSNSKGGWSLNYGDGVSADEGNNEVTLADLDSENAVKDKKYKQVVTTCKGMSHKVRIPFAEFNLAMKKLAKKGGDETKVKLRFGTGRNQYTLFAQKGKSQSKMDKDFWSQYK